MSPADQQEALSQYATKGTTTHGVPPAKQSRQEQEGAKYWESKKNEKQQKEKQPAKPQTKPTAGKKSSSAATDLLAGGGLGTEGANRLLEEGGFDKLDYDEFMKQMDLHDIDPQEFAESARHLADALDIDGGSQALEEDAKALAKKVAEEYTSSGGRAGMKSTGSDIWGDDEVPLEETVAAASNMPKYRMKVIKGEDISEDMLEITVELPLLTSIADVDLDVEEDQLSLEASDVYSLKIDLSHRVDDDEVKARFDKASSTLVLLAPVIYD